MKYFTQLGQDIPVDALVASIAGKPHLWHANRARTTFPGTPHGEVADILVRFGTSTRDATSHWHPAASELPEVFPLLRGVMFTSNAYQLDRVIISSLPPGGQILAHTDNVGEYTADLDRVRLHLVLNGTGGNIFNCGDETVDMKTGDLWAFDARTKHSCQNTGTEPRVHLLVDVRRMP